MIVDPRIMEYLPSFTSGPSERVPDSLGVVTNHSLGGPDGTAEAYSELLSSFEATHRRIYRIFSPLAKLLSRIYLFLPAESAVLIKDVTAVLISSPFC